MSLTEPLAHPQVQRLAESLRERPGSPTDPEGIGAWAAVAAVIRAAPDSAELLFIRRVERDGDSWSGQVALPGGRQDDSDDSLLATAVRETWEEIGLDLTAHGEALGVLDDVAPRTPVLPPIAVRPWVFVTTTEAPLSAGVEVADIFWVPLDLLCDESRWKTTAVVAHGLRMEVQAIVYGEHVIWGMTFRVVQQLAERLGG